MARKWYKGVPVLCDSRSGDVDEFLTSLASSVLKKRPGARLEVAGSLYTLDSELLQRVQDLPPLPAFFTPSVSAALEPRAVNSSRPH